MIDWDLLVGHRVQGVDRAQEQGDEQAQPPWDHLRWYQETDLKFIA